MLEITVHKDEEVISRASKQEALEYYKWVMRILLQRMTIIEWCDNRTKFEIDLSLLWKL